METEISDFQEMVFTVLKMFNKKQNQKSFTTETKKPSMSICFKEELNNELLIIDINNAELLTQNLRILF